MFKDLNDMITDQLVIGRQKSHQKRNSKISRKTLKHNMQDTLIVIILSFVYPIFIGGMLFLLSFLISKNTKSSLEEGFRLTQIMLVLAVAVLIFLFSS
jgi:hypothetical protein